MNSTTMINIAIGTMIKKKCEKCGMRKPIEQTKHFNDIGWFCLSCYKARLGEPK